ncbi:lysine exporter LysO family protein [Tissierella carlieri]|uniref:Lysine exporter LysO family protein n=1 Tax=Tissierella carlieri TaxID=689904 RepID=A0ABT1S4V3_9FIRM|nr:LysO family transporter [Tissierella carlieri]MCQ4921498.1 lysine exporter LysO family protein [Tissierella carlieri]
MGLRLILYLGILILGGIIGYKDKVSEKLQANINTIQNLCLLFLLFVMGVTIGINNEVISNLFSIGLKAGIISIFTISFSIIFVRVIRRFIILESDKIEP